MRVFGIEVQFAAQNVFAANATYERRPAHVPGADFEASLAADGTPSSKTTHRVENGENLTRIVHRHLSEGGMRPSNAEVYAGVQAVARANGLSNPNLIHPGQMLDLSVLERGSRSTEPANTAAPLSAVGVPTARTVHGTPAPRQTVGKVVPLSDPGMEQRSDAAPLDPEDILLREAGDAPAGEPVRIAASAVAALMTPPAPAADTALAARHRTGASGGGGPVPSDAAIALQRILNRTSNALHALRGLVDGPPVYQVTPQSPWDALLQGKARISSEFGTRRDPFTGRMEFHDGIDLAAKRGTEITAVRDGEVVFAGWKGGYGKTVVLRHADGVETLYAHASELQVQTGQVVKAGDIVAGVGSSGRSTGPHVHFEVREHGRAVNPLPYLEQPVTRLAENPS